jgi:hypothetical protein
MGVWSLMGALSLEGACSLISAVSPMLKLKDCSLVDRYVGDVGRGFRAGCDGFLDRIGDLMIGGADQ